MRCKHSYIIFLALVLLTVLATVGSAAVRLYLYPPSPTYFSSLNIGDSFTVEIVAEVDGPKENGVTLFTFLMTWAPAGSVEFVRPTNAQELVMTGFFPPSSPDFSRLSGIAPDWTSDESVGSPGATPEITVYTAPAENYAGTDSLARITLRKLSSSYPSINLTNAKAVQHLSGSESAWVTATTQIAYAGADAGQAVMSGIKPSQATSVVVNIGGRDYSANVNGDTWMLDIASITPSLSAQPVTVKTMQGGTPLTSVTIMEVIRSPGWFENQGNHSEQPGDSDGDGDTDLTDLLKFGQSYSTFAGDSGYDFRCDYNADRSVNLFDLLILGLYYGN